MANRKQHFVTFVSPGTLFHEESSKPIESWDAAIAVSMSKAITERHGAKPFGFYFTTSVVADPVDDGMGGTMKVVPKEIAKSGMHYIGGVIDSYDDVVSRDLKDESILRSNMRCNDIAYVVTNRNSYKSVNDFDEKDVVVDPDSGAIVERGDSPERKKYRKHRIVEHKRELAAIGVR